MVEWDEDESTRNVQGTWSVHWEGMPPQRSATMESEEFDGSEAAQPKKASASTSTRSATHRRYFLLGPKRGVPSSVTIILSPSDSALEPIEWKTNALPAIFPKELGSEEHGRLGVLHTRWATMRMDTLDSEIESEAKTSPEGIALHMALTEREWIVTKFGVGTSLESPSEQSPTVEAVPKSPLGLQIRPIGYGQVPGSPTSPTSPGGSRLSEKLKGLKLQTAASSSTASDEVAVPLSKCKVEKMMAASGTPPAKPAQSALPSGGASMGSIGAMLAGDDSAAAPVVAASRQEEDEAELFALPLSPRSPEMTKSPFSFTTEDTRRYASAQEVL
jgi:hypothetical protein